jgi:hypothetical protein
VNVGVTDRQCEAVGPTALTTCRSTLELVTNSGIPSHRRSDGRPTSGNHHPAAGTIVALRPNVFANANSQRGDERAGQKLGLAMTASRAGSPT